MAISIRDIKNYQRTSTDAVITELHKPEQKSHKKNLLTKLKRGAAVAAVASIALIIPSASLRKSSFDIAFLYTVLRLHTSPPPHDPVQLLSILPNSASDSWRYASEPVREYALAQATDHHPH